MRLLCCQDTDEATAIFSDEEYQAFLSLEENNVRRGAALALETVASSEAFIQKAVKISNLQTNGPSVAAELRARAKSLREQATDAENRAGGLFDYAEQVGTEFQWNQAVWNAHLRGGF